MSARLGLINPNTSVADTDEMERAVRSVLPSDIEVVTATAGRGASRIETSAEESVARAEVVDMVRGLPCLDMYLIGCFSDPAVWSVRELTDAPVIGAGEAAYRTVSLLARRFAVVTTLRRGVPDLEDTLEAQGLRGACVGVVALDEVASHPDDGVDGTSTALRAGRRAVHDLGAEAVLLACTALTGIEVPLSRALGVPVTAGVRVGAALVAALWRVGLRTSTVGSLAGERAC